MSKKNKVLASVLAMSMITVNVTSFVADAATIPDVNSDFEYDLAIEPVSNSQIKVKFYTVNNPGVQSFSLGLVFDSSRYNFVRRTTSSNLSECLTGVSKGVNEENGVGIFAFTMDGDQLTQGDQDFTEDFEVSFYIEIENGNIFDATLSSFSVAVVGYLSNTENLDIDRRANGYNPVTDPPETGLVLRKP